MKRRKMNSSKKGANGERELAEILKSYGYTIERGGTQSYGCAPDLMGLQGIHIECKRVEKLNILEAMKQSERDAQKFNDGAPAVFHRKNRAPWFVTMRLSDWMKLYQRGSGNYDALEKVD